VADLVHELVPTARTLGKLAARNISFTEATELPGNRHVVARNPSEPERRRLLVGATDGGRVLTFVIEQTVDPTTWLVVTGWSATLAEP
jgi:uncharacterized DUF497 family protein